MKPFEPFAGHTGKNFFLPGVQSSPHPVVELGFLDQEIHHPLGVILGVQNDRRKIVYPFIDGVILVAPLQHAIIGSPLLLDDLGERDQNRLAKRLRQDFLGEAPRNTAVADLRTDGC